MIFGRSDILKKIAVITGASSGMGKEFAIQLNKKMRNIDEVWLIARRRDRMDEIREEINTPCVIIDEDITKESFRTKYKKMLKQENPNVRMLVNCAGYGLTGNVEDKPEELSVGMIDTNCRALTSITIDTIPYIGEGGRIVNFASSAAFLPQPGFAIYAATKSYVLSFSRALNSELKSKNISVTAVCPGPVNTDFFRIADDGIKSVRPWYKDYFMAAAPDVVRQALSDAAKRKEISVYGKSMNMFFVLTKIIPHSLIIKIMTKLQRTVK